MTTPTTPLGEFLENVADEFLRACSLFPGATLNLAALTEEVGELAQAMLDVRTGKHGRAWQEVYAEAVQVAAMAARCALQGDETIATPS